MGSLRVVQYTIYTPVRGGPVPIPSRGTFSPIHPQTPFLLAPHRPMVLGFQLPVFTINQPVNNEGPKLYAPTPRSKSYKGLTGRITCVRLCEMDALNSLEKGGMWQLSKDS